MHFLWSGLRLASTSDIVMETTGPTQGVLDDKENEEDDEEMSGEEEEQDSEEEMDDDAEDEVGDSIVHTTNMTEVNTQQSVA